MAIPDFQSLLFPIIECIADGQSHSISEVIDTLGKKFNLSDEELNQYLASGSQKIFYNRVYWAKAHLKMAGLVENNRRGHFIITETGKQVLTERPEGMNLKYLRRFPEYVERFESPRDSIKPDISPIQVEPTETPEEIIADNYLRIRKALSIELLSKVKESSPAFFEQLVVELLVKMGYGGSVSEAGKATRLSNDGGIDGIIKEDKLGLDSIYIQAKRWDTQSVGRPDIQSFVGALDGQRSSKGVFITTSKFSDTALEYVRTISKKVILIDGEQLTNYMIEYGLGVSTFNTYNMKKIDQDYFEEN